MSKEENPWRQTVEPTVIQSRSATDMTTEEHPAYAVIRANRVSGSTALFNSDFKHDAFISVAIAKASLNRTLSNDWVHGNIGEMIEVHLSEAQWAAFVSSLNIGTGTPCTLHHVNSVPVPGIARPTNRHEQFKKESNAAVEKARASLNELRAEIEKSGLSKKKQDEMLWKVEFAERGIASSQDFIAKQFGEHIERTVEHAKAEVAGYISGAVRQLGLQSLAAGDGPGVAPLRLGFPGDDIMDE